MKVGTELFYIPVRQLRRSINCTNGTQYSFPLNDLILNRLTDLLWVMGLSDSGKNRTVVIFKIV